MWTRRELKRTAKASLKLYYWKSVLVAILLASLTQVVTFSSGASGVNTATREGVKSQLRQYAQTLSESEQEQLAYTIIAFMSTLVLLAFVIGIIGIIADIFVFNPLMVGIRKFSLDSVRANEEGEISDLGRGFDVAYKANVKTMFMTDLFIFLWSLLLIVPGIIKCYQYRLVSFILIDNPGMPYREVQAQSKQLMHGNKWRAFILDISFIGWDILNAFTLGILGVFYVGPYKMLTDAALYDALALGGIRYGASYGTPYGTQYETPSEAAMAGTATEPVVVTAPEASVQSDMSSGVQTSGDAQ